jgi:hypothetical protein
MIQLLIVLLMALTQGNSDTICSIGAPADTGWREAHPNSGVVAAAMVSGDFELYILDPDVSVEEPERVFVLVGISDAGDQIVMCAQSVLPDDVFSPSDTIRPQDIR